MENIKEKICTIVKYVKNKNGHKIMERESGYFRELADKKEL